MRAAGAAFLGAGAKGFVDDGLDGARAAAAFGAAAKAPIELLGVPRKDVCRLHGVADVVIAEDVAGTDNHLGQQTFRVAPQSIFKRAQ